MAKNGKKLEKFFLVDNFFRLLSPNISNYARAPSVNLSPKARLSRVHLKEVELAKGVRGDKTVQGLQTAWKA